MDRHVLLKKLRDVLESLKGRVAGRNKDDVEEAISMVCCPSLILSYYLSGYVNACMLCVMHLIVFCLFCFNASFGFFLYLHIC